MRCADAATSASMIAEVDAARKDGDTLGGVVEVVVHGLPPGLGSFTQWDRKLDARLAGALVSIQAIKGVEFGDGFTTADQARLATRTTRSTSARTGCAGAPTGPAGSRAACRPARCSGCGPR